MKLMNAVICLLLFCFCFSTFANTDTRKWTLASGESFDAELVKYDAVKGAAVLLIDNKQEKRLPAD